MPGGPVIDDAAKVGNRLLITGEGRIARKYRELGGEAALGQPVSTQPDVVWTLATGMSIVDNPRLFRAFEIHGAIHAKWLALGGVAFGIPDTDETGTPDGRGRFNHFNDNSASIYWTPETGAHLVYGDIRARWSELGWERSYLGYPVTDEVPSPTAGAPASSSTAASTGGRTPARSTFATSSFTTPGCTASARPTGTRAPTPTSRTC